MDNLEKYLNLFQGIDFKGIIAEDVINVVGKKGVKVIQQSFNKIKEYYTKPEKGEYFYDFEFEVSAEILISRISSNIDISYKWSKEINFKMLPESKQLKEIFLELDIYISQLRERVDSTYELPIISSKELANKLDKNVILYGGPGAGKSTLIMNLFNKIIESGYRNKKFNFPFLIRFRDLTYPRDPIPSYYGLFEIILLSFGVSITDINYIINQESVKKTMKK